MKTTRKMIIFSNNLGLGLMVPVLSLFILCHGCSIQRLSLVMGLYSATVVMAEVPSGMFADIWGKKKCYYLSCTFLLFSFLIMYSSRNMFLLIAGIMFLGLSKAFLSGSLDSLIIEECIQRNGDAALSKISSSNLIYQCSGIALGSLAGGIIPNVKGYLIHVIVRVAILLLVVIMVHFCLVENTRGVVEQKKLIYQVRLVSKEIKSKMMLRIIFLIIFSSSIALFALETYWQSQFTSIILPAQHYLLGVLCSVGYAGNILGCMLTGHLKMENDKKRWKYYFTFSILLGTGLVLISQQRNIGGFMFFYVLQQVIVGIASVPEQTLLNSFVTNESRASMLSVANLFSQMAGVLISPVCTFMILRIKIDGTLLFMGIVSTIMIFTAYIFINIKFKKDKGKEALQTKSEACIHRAL